MSLGTLERPAPAPVERPEAESAGRMPFRLTALRMALRDVRRNKRQAVLLVLLIAIPTMVAIGAGAIAATYGLDGGDDRFGAADARVRFDSGPLVDRQLDEVEMLLEGAGATGAAIRLIGYPFTLADLHNNLAEGTVRVHEGRLARTADEMTMAPHHAERLGFAVGDEVLAHGQRFTLVGLASGDNVNMVAPLAALPRLRDTIEFFAVDVLVRAPDLDAFAANLRELARADEQFANRPRPDAEPPLLQDLWIDRSDRVAAAPMILDFWTTPEGISLLVALVSLIGTGLIAAGAWTTRIQRRLRLLGLLSSNGADGRHLRSAVLGEATAIGLVGASLGGIAAIVLLRLFAIDLLTRLDGDAPTTLTVTVGSVALPLSLGILASVGAALVPAHRASRIPAQAALAGRAPTGELRPGLQGLALLVGSLSLAVIAAVTGTRVSLDELGVLALLLAMIGLFGAAAVLMLPAIALVGRFAHALPSRTRMAFRDAARQRARTGAAVAVVAAVMVFPVAIGVNHESGSNRPADLPEPRSIAIFEEAPVRRADTPVDVAAASAAVADAQLRLTVPAIPDVSLFITDTDVIRQSGWDPDAEGRIDLARRETLLLLDDEQLDALDVTGARRAAIDRGAVSVGWDCPPAWLAVPVVLESAALTTRVEAHCTTRDPAIGAEAALVADVMTEERPVARIEAAAVEDLAFERLLWRPIMHVEAAPGPPTTTVSMVAKAGVWKWDAFRDVAARHGAQANVDVLDQWWQPSMVPYVMSLGAGMLLAMIVVGLTVSLTATELDRDLATMQAVGAEPRLRKQILARQAWLVTFLGSTMAVALVLVAATTDLLGVSRDPWAVASIPIVVLGAPLVVAGAVRLCSKAGAVIATRRLV